MAMWLRSQVLDVARGLLDLLAPGLCRSCGGLAEDAAALCRACERDVPWIDEACGYCGSALAPGAVPAASSPRDRAPRRGAVLGRCAECRERVFGFDRVIASARYDGPARDLVLAHKFRGDLGARRELARWLAGSWRRAAVEHGASAAEPGGRVPSPGAERWWVAPVPVHWRRRLRRGGDPCGELARELARQAGLPFRELLRKTRATPSQVDLTGEERRRNLFTAFRPRWSARRALPSGRGRGRGRGQRSPAHVLLVDDVVTTCTTVSRCARALRRAGAGRIVVLAVCRSSAEGAR